MKLLVVVGTVVFALSLLSNVAAQAEGEKTKIDMEPPNDLDGKGLFVLTPHKVRELQVKSITTSDWLYDIDGRHTDRQRGAYVQYDELGRLIRFTGQTYRGDHVEVECQYDKEGRILEQKLFSKGGEVRKLAVRGVFDYVNPRVMEKVVYGRDGALVSRTRHSLDDAGRVAKMEELDPASGDVLAEGKRTYDKKGNFVDEYGAEGRTAHSFENNVLTVSNYVGSKGWMSKGTLSSVKEYTFDDRGNLLSFFRKSGDGSFWDRFSYKLDGQGLPVEKIWSKLEYILQDPYELTKYSYEFYK